jgi:hypothetical protein
MSNDGDTVAIGAIGHNDFAGHVRVYDWSGSSWTQRGSDIDGEAVDDNSGTSVAMSNDGDTVAIGAIGNNDLTGHVRVYDWSGSSWVKRGSDIDGEAPGDYSGTSVAMSYDGDTVAIGAIGNNDLAGHVRVYDWSGSSWTQRGSDIDSEAAGDHYGTSVAMSSDGNTIAIGAPRNIGSAYSEGGHVRVYTWGGSSWTQRGSDIDSDAVYGQSGFAVAMSSDGNTVAIGGPYYSAGYTRVYAWG